MVLSEARRVLQLIIQSLILREPKRPVSSYRAGSPRGANQGRTNDKDLHHKMERAARFSV